MLGIVDYLVSSEHTETLHSSHEDARGCGKLALVNNKWGMKQEYILKSYLLAAKKNEMGTCVFAVMPTA